MLLLDASPVGYEQVIMPLVWPGLIGLLSGLHLAGITHGVTSIRHTLNFRPAC